MANQVVPTEKFESQYKRLRKKFKTLDSTIYELEKQLIFNPYIGTRLNQNTFKIRVSDPSKGKGKSGGFRVITYIVEESQDLTTILLLTIYDKSEQSNVSSADLMNWKRDIDNKRKPQN